MVLEILLLALGIYTAQKMKFSIKDFSSKCDQIRRKLWIWSYLLQKSFMENFIFCAVLRLWRCIFLDFTWTHVSTGWLISTSVSFYFSFFSRLFITFLLSIWWIRSILDSIIFYLYQHLINHISRSSNVFSRISLFEQYTYCLTVRHRPFSWTLTICVFVALDSCVYSCLKYHEMSFIYNYSHIAINLFYLHDLKT